MAVNQLKAGVVLNYATIALHTLGGLLYTPFMLRMLGQSEWGLYSLVSSVISYLTILDFGFGNATIRYTAKFRAEGKTTEQYQFFGMVFTLYLIIGIMAFIGGLALYFNVDNMFGATMTEYELGRAKIMMLILIFNVAITFPLSIFGSVITAYEKFVFLKIVGILRIILNYVVMIVLLTMGYKAVAMVIVVTAFNVLTLFVNFAYCKYKLHCKFLFSGFNWSLLKEVAMYSFWIFLAVIMNRIYWSTGQFVLGIVAGTTAVAVYSVAIRLESMYMQFSTAVVSVFLPKVTGMVTNNKSDKEISDLFIKTGRIQYIIISFILSSFIVFGQQFINIWAVKGYENAFIITLLFFVSLGVPLIQNMGITILQARNQLKFRSLIYLAIAAVALIFQIILSKSYGEIGCAVAVAGALLIGQGIIMNIYYKRKQRLDINSFWKEILKMTIVPVIMILIGVFVMKYIECRNLWQLILAVTGFSILYIPAFWTFSMNSYERELILKPIHNRVHKKQMNLS